MLTLCAWIVLLGLVLTFTFFQVSAGISIATLVVLMIFYSLFHVLSIPSLVIIWLLLASLSLILFVNPFRKKYFIKPFIRWFRKQQPEITEAEQQVLDAGGLWWERQFFSGKPNWEELKSLNQPKLTGEEQAFIDNQVKTLCSLLIQQNANNEQGTLSPKIWEYIKKEKFWGLGIDKQYGGLGFSAIAHSTIITMVAARSCSAAFTVMVPNSLGPGELISHYGTSDQKTHFLPKLAAGEEIPCFALTAPHAGSDATSLVDEGVVCRGVFDGKETLGIRLNWEKRYITLAPIATLIGLAIQLKDPEHLLGDQDNIGITLALVPSHLTGIEIGKQHNPLNIGFLNGPIRGKDVFIPIDYIIGGVERRGEGWQMMMECLAVGRGISLPALSAAYSQLCFKTTGAYSVVREQFARSIGSFDGIKEVLARIGGFTYLCEATRLFTAAAVDSGARPAVASAIAKYHLTELSRHVVNDAMDIHAGRGIQLGPKNYLGYLHSCIPVNITVEGANILTRNLIIFGQGAMRCHPYLRAEIAAADPKDPKKVAEFDRLLLKHLGDMISSASRVFLYGLTGGRLITCVEKEWLAKYLRQLTRMTAAFNLVTNITFATMGKKLKLKETLSARLGDILSHFYMASAALKYFYDNDEQKDDEIFLQWSLTYCLYQIEQAFHDFFNNFPKRWLAKLLQIFIFPWGRAYSFPKDHLSFELANFMQQHSELRERITKCCYTSQSSNDPVSRMEEAMQQLKNAEPILKKLAKKGHNQWRQAKLANWINNAYNDNLIDEQERDQLLQLDQILREVIQVDEFASIREKSQILSEQDKPERIGS